jgi:hypothetical protein
MLLKDVINWLGCSGDNWMLWEPQGITAFNEKKECY